MTERSSGTSDGSPEEARDDLAGAGELTARLYNELRETAQKMMAQWSPRQTLQPTALVHEVYLKLARQPEEWEGRRHFLCVAAKAMRQVLADYAKARRAQKRGGGWQVVTLEGSSLASPGSSSDDLDLLVLDEALSELSEAEPRSARIVELRFLVGMQIDEVAEVLGISPTTVKEDWRAARAWLRRRLTPGVGPESRG